MTTRSGKHLGSIVYPEPVDSQRLDNVVDATSVTSVHQIQTSCDSPPRKRRSMVVESDEFDFTPVKKNKGRQVLPK